MNLHTRKSFKNNSLDHVDPKIPNRGSMEFRPILLFTPFVSKCRIFLGIPGLTPIIIPNKNCKNLPGRKTYILLRLIDTSIAIIITKCCTHMHTYKSIHFIKSEAGD